MHASTAILLSDLRDRKMDLAVFVMHFHGWECELRQQHQFEAKGTQLSKKYINPYTAFDLPAVYYVYKF